MDGLRHCAPEPPAPTTAAAMKAVLTQERFSDPDWIFERKLDGIRCVAIRDGGPVRLLSRNDLSLNGRFPGVAAALDAQPASASRRRRGRRLRGRADELPAPRASGRRDLLLRLRPAVARRRGRPRAAAARAQGAAARRAVLRGPAPAERLPQRGRRGDVRGGLPQGLGGRDRQARRQRLHRQALARLAEVQVRAGPGARDRRLHRARAARARSSARCSSASTTPTARCATRARSARASTARRCGSSARACAQLRREDSPFADAPRYRDATWVEPSLVAQVGFAEWTTAGRLRHPRFLGLRDDKPARSVVREAP